MATVEVWQVDLAREELVPRLAVLLTSAERERAARLKRPGRAERWTVARAALRIVLGARLGFPPEDVELALSVHGKPYLEGERLRFNLSHSGDRAVIALADGIEVGIDLERTSRSSAAVGRTLSERERASGDDLLQLWCRKEALAKAIGGGLNWRPQDFDTTRPGDYTLADLPLDPGYVGALAVAGERADFTLHRLAL